MAVDIPLLKDLLNRLGEIEPEITDELFVGNPDWQDDLSDTIDYVEEGGSSSTADQYANLDTQAITADVAELAFPPTGVGYKFQPDADDWKITGIDNPAESQVILLFNPTEYILKLMHDDAAATAIKRLRLPKDQDINLTPRTSLSVFYDLGEQRWFVAGSAPGVDVLPPAGSGAAQNSSISNTISSLESVSLDDIVDWDPGVDPENKTGWRITTTGANTVDIDSMAPPTTGGDAVFLLLNAGPENIRLRHERAAATAAWRFEMPGAGNVVVQPSGSIYIYYSTADSRWFVLLER